MRWTWMPVAVALFAGAAPAAARAATVHIAAGPAGPTNDAQPAFTFESDATLTDCRLDGPNGAAGLATPCTSTYQPPTALGDGDYTFVVHGTDVTGDAQDSRAFTVDTVAPETTIAGGPATPTNAAAVTFTPQSEPGATFTCALARPDGTTLGPAACNSSVTYPDLPQEGGYAFTVFATDP